ncbi:serine/threonine protein kinase, CMGC, CDC2/CDK sub [Massospora cicadina]|nr:serine/threonine protein kinase, CMGC, CDC2/CDK sub [Massospora cicadina]
MESIPLNKRHSERAQDLETKYTNPWMSPSAQSFYAYPSSLASETNSNASPYNVRLDARKFFGCSPISDYIFERKLGEGTFGEVYKGRHVTSQEPVALKRIIIHNVDEGMPITAIREIKILKSLKHDNILSLSDMAVAKGNAPFLRELSQPRGPVVVEEVNLLYGHALHGSRSLRYLHENEILHRDIKVANLLVNNKGVLKIADFGLSRYRLQSEELTNCVVTRWYRPPEILLGDKNYTYAIDMWGIGCVFAQMLCCEPLLPGKSDVEQLNLIFKLCGSPTDETMPGWRDLPSSDVVELGSGTHSRIRERFRDYDKPTVDMLEGLLTLDPAKRITAKEALEHPLFSTAPLPAHHSCLPQYTSSHELDHFESRRGQKRPAVEPLRRPPKVSPANRANEPFQPRHSSRADIHLHGHRADDRNPRPSGRRDSRDRGPRLAGPRGAPDSRNSQRSYFYKDGNRHRSGGGHNRHRR